MEPSKLFYRDWSVWISAFIMIGLAVASIADDNTICFWQVCSISDGEKATCALASSGGEAEFERADRDTRKPGMIMNRECVQVGTRPALAWKGCNVFFSSESNKGKK